MEQTSKSYFHGCMYETVTKAKWASRYTVNTFANYLLATGTVQTFVVKATTAQKVQELTFSHALLVPSVIPPAWDKRMNAHSVLVRLEKKLYFTQVFFYATQHIIPNLYFIML